MKTFQEFLAESWDKPGTKIDVKNSVHAVNWLNKMFKKQHSKNFATALNKTTVELTDNVAGADVDIVDNYLDEFGGKYSK